MDSIGFFQLENLIVSRNNFIFLNVGAVEPEKLPEPLNRYLRQAVPVVREDVHDHLTQAGVTKERPVILVSETEKEASLVAGDLETAGFTNVYIIAGGVVGLLSEL